MAQEVILYEKGKDPLYNIWHENEKGSYLYIHSGEGSLVFSDIIFPIKKGCLYYIPSKKQHYTLPQNSDEYVRSKILISDEHSAKIIISALNDISYSAHSVLYAELPPEEQKSVELIYSLLKKAQIREEIDRMFLTGCVLQLHSYLMTYRTHKSQALDDYIERSLQYINSNISSQLTIDSIAGAVSLSKYYFCHIFKKTLGVSVMKYVLDTRLSLAKELLVVGKYPISRIAEKCGFETTSNFCHQFKKHTGMTATGYKKSFTSERN